MTSACTELAELRSAFVDGALNAADYDRLSAHLAGCESCRRDVADLRVVHELVRGNARRDVGTPSDLSQRLVSIAGAQSASRSAGGSGWDGRGRHRVVRIRATAATAALGAALAAVGVTGYLAAPAGLATVADPSAEAAIEFTAALGQLPLSNDGVDGVFRVRRGSLTLADRAAPTDEPPLAAGESVPSAEVLTRLSRATAAAASVDFVGEQSLHAYASGQTYAAKVQVVSQPGQGSQINLVSQNGRAMASDVSRAAGSSRLTDTSMLTLLKQNYDLSGFRGGIVAGRPATMLVASRGGVVAGRWWVDDDTGLVLWRQRLDSSRQVQLSTGFTSIQLVSRPDLVANLPPAPVEPNADVALTLSSTDPLTAGGWPCQHDLAGLSLLKLRADRAADPQAVHLVYSDGLSTVGVYEQRGRLGNPPTGSTWDPATRAYVSPGAASLASWQSGDTVITVVTDGSPQLLARAVTELPHEPQRQQTTMERVKAGWGRILATVRG